jgi:hypothetical protein
MVGQQMSIPVNKKRKKMRKGNVVVGLLWLGLSLLLTVMWMIDIAGRSN